MSNIYDPSHTWRKNPVYKEGKLCPKCNTTKKLIVSRKHPHTNEPYSTIRCLQCKKNVNNKYCRDNPQAHAKWQKKNAEHIRAYQREYYRPKYKERNGVNAKRVRERTVYNDKKEIQKFYRNCPTGYEVDHIVPLNGKNVSGLHTMSNLQYLLVSENRSKSNKFN
jgi:hypothetical protein